MQILGILKIQLMPIYQIVFIPLTKLRNGLIALPDGPEVVLLAAALGLLGVQSKTVIVDAEPVPALDVVLQNLQPLQQLLQPRTSENALHQPEDSAVALKNL